MFNIIMTFLPFLICLAIIVGRWRIFVKAGEKGWKSIIPFYSDYISYKIVWETLWFWVIISLVIIRVILATFLPDNNIALFVSFVIITFIAIIEIVKIHKLSTSFGYGGGFTVGLIFLNPIFMLILGFGPSKYLGADIPTIE